MIKLFYLLFFILFINFSQVFAGSKLDLQNRGLEEEEEEDDAGTESSDGPHGKDVYSFLATRLKQDLGLKKRLPAKIYTIPGPQEPLPGRSHQGDYWPVFPFQNQFSGGLDLDPSTSRHLGGDLNIAVPSFGMMDIYGRSYTRIGDSTTKFGYLNHPVNMLDLEKEDFVKLMSDPAVQHNRMAHPTIPLGKFAKNYVPMSCKPPLCNPYTMNFALGIEQDYNRDNGWEGDIDLGMPISKGIFYRLPLSGNIYYARDNITVTYGQNLSPIEPFSSLFDYQKHRDPALRIPRRWTRSIPENPPVEEHHKPQMLPSSNQFLPYQMAMMPILNTPPFNYYINGIHPNFETITNIPQIRSRRRRRERAFIDPFNFYM